jgi:manganese/zinc/iron transport system permease protein
MHYLLMTITSITAVYCFEVVGSILVIAMLIVPAACARLLSDRLGATLGWAVLLAALAAPLGHALALYIPARFGFPATSSSGGMAVAAGLLFSAGLVFAPRHGLLRRVLHQRRLHLLTLEEDVLANLMRAADQAHPMTRADVVARVPDARRLRAALGRLRRRGYVEGLELTHKGLQAGAGLLRSHRLWESWLHEHTPLALDHLHEAAERLEHVTDAALRERLAGEAGAPRRDPMGRPIPPDVSQGPETVIAGDQTSAS